MIDGPFLRAPKFGALDRGALILMQLVEQTLLNLDKYKPSSCTGPFRSEWYHAQLHPDQSEQYH